MSLELQQIKRRIAGTRQIRKVTSALRQVASARLVHERRALETAQRFLDELDELVWALLPEAADEPPRWCRPGRGARRALIVFGSDRGLCGGYNTAVVDCLARTAPPGDADGTDLLVVGRVVRRRALRQGYAVAHHFHQPPRDERHGMVARLAGLAADGFERGVWNRVDLLTTELSGPLRAEAVVRPLLPVRPAPGTRASPSLTLCEPDATAILERLLPLQLRQRLSTAFLSSLAAEDAARQAAMSRASENAAEILRTLNLTYARLRQDSITSEMIDLIGAAMPGAGGKES